MPLNDFRQMLAILRRTHDSAATTRKSTYTFIKSIHISSIEVRA
jgi:hypothetical protein